MIRTAGVGPRELLAAAVAPLLLGGCYALGFEPEPGIGGALAVPIFANETLRRGLEHELTRHLRREVLETTPLHLAREGDAAATLRGTVVGVREGALITGPAEEVVYSSVTVTVRFGVYDGAATAGDDAAAAGTRPRLIVGEDTDGDGVPDAEVVLATSAPFDLTRGQTRETATDAALRDLAEMIVLRLQRRHDDRYEPNDRPERAAALEPGLYGGLIQRDPDWFRVTVPARHALRGTIYFSRGDLSIRAAAPDGRTLPQADVVDDGRAVHLVVGEAARDVLLEVTGDGGGAEYRLQLDARPDDRFEPNDGPNAATPLLPGVRLHLLQRDEDWFVVTVPPERSLTVELTVPSDDRGALRVEAAGDHGAIAPPRLPPSGDELPDARELPPAGPEAGAEAGGGAGSKTGRDAPPPRARRATLTVPAVPEPRAITLRVTGDDVGRAYTLEARIGP